jgi:hypothetical protein
MTSFATATVRRAGQRQSVAPLMSIIISSPFTGRNTLIRLLTAGWPAAAL